MPNLDPYCKIMRSPPARALLALGLILAMLTAAGSMSWAQPPAEEPSRQALSASGKPAAPAPNIYHGNLKSKKFHRSGCRYYDCKNCKAEFKSRQAAIKAGYIPCKVCRP